MKSPAASARRRSFNDLSVNLKIVSAVAVSSLVALSVSVLGWQGLGETNGYADKLYNSNVTSVTALGDLKAAFLKTRLDMMSHATLPDKANKAEYRKAFAADQKAAAAAFAAYRDSHPASDVAVIDQLEADYDEYVKIAEEKLLPASDRNDLTTWRKIREVETVPVAKRATASLAAMGTVENADAEATAGAAQESYDSNLTISIVMLLVGLTAGLGLGVFVARQIVRSLRKVHAVCDSLAAGDLTQTAGLTSLDEPGRMGRALDAAVARLRETVTTIGGSAVTLAGASRELSGVSSQLQSGAADAAAQAGAASQATEEVNAGVQTIAAGAE
ncbi:Tar ligand binding domain-containing protein, partial [Actinoplanes lobatus]